MNTSKKISLLQRLLDQSDELRVRDSDDPTFKTWKNTVERTLIRVFGAESLELSQFHKLRFFYTAIIMSLGADYTRQHRECFERDFKILISSIRNYIEELENERLEEEEVAARPALGTGIVGRVFISHSSKDEKVVEELVELLEVIGLSGETIFCTSFAGYGVDFGENFLETIKDELSADCLVLFVLTKNFYNSPVCLCEMGAAWVQTKEHIPILVPPLDFDDVKGVIPLTQGFKINDAPKLNLFKEKIEAAFGVNSGLSQSAWERKRDRIVSRLNEKISQ